MRVIACLLAVLAGAFSAAQAPERHWLYAELIGMQMADQEVRNRAVALMQAGKPVPLDVVREMQRTDRRHTRKLKGIITDWGWPTISMVGKEAATAAWLIAQHADADPAFQAKVLRLMEPHAKTGNVSGVQFAMLTDRWRVNTGKKQIYGTQMRLVNGKVQPLDLEDPKNVDKRRKAVGMPPLSEYMEQIRRAYGGR